MSLQPSCQPHCSTNRRQPWGEMLPAYVTAMEQSSVQNVCLDRRVLALNKQSSHASLLCWHALIASIPLHPLNVQPKALKHRQHRDMALHPRPRTLSARARTDAILGLITFTPFHVPCHMTHEGVGPGSLLSASGIAA